jgi:hypothetical protein
MPFDTLEDSMSLLRAAMGDCPSDAPGATIWGMIEAFIKRFKVLDQELLDWPKEYFESVDFEQCCIELVHKNVGEELRSKELLTQSPRWFAIPLKGGQVWLKVPTLGQEWRKFQAGSWSWCKNLRYLERDASQSCQGRLSDLQVYRQHSSLLEENFSASAVLAFVDIISLKQQ